MGDDSDATGRFTDRLATDLATDTGKEVEIKDLSTGEVVGFASPIPSRPESKTHHALFAGMTDERFCKIFGRKGTGFIGNKTDIVQ